METKKQTQLERMKSPTKKALKNKMKHPLFINEYEILSSLGEGNTSKVYLVRSIKDPKKQFALKLLREEFLQRDKDSIKSVE
jgi:serine/threonine protein kinase